MPLTSTLFLPVLVSSTGGRHARQHIVDPFVPGIDVAYSCGPRYGEVLVTDDDLAELGVTRRDLRGAAADNLELAAQQLRIDGQPPSLTLSFEGMESAALLVDAVWDDLEPTIPGQLVAAVPARDVVIITSSLTPAGLSDARRAVQRVFFAGVPHLLSRELLVRHQGRWQVFPSAEPAGRTWWPSGRVR